MPTTGKKILRYNLILDSDVLRRSETHETLKDLDRVGKTHRNCKVRYFIPEVVKEEYKYYFFEELIGRSIRGYQEGAGLLNKKLGIKIEMRKIEQELVEGAWMKELNKFKVLRLPDEKHLKKIMETAAWRLFPFEDGTKKFRDGLILYSLQLEMEKLTKDADVAIVSGDGKFREVLKKGFQKNKRVLVYESVPRFKSDLMLSLQTANEEFRAKIKKGAESVFLELAGKEKVEGKIKSEYSDLFTKPEIEELPYAGIGLRSAEEKWEAVDEGQFWMKKPRFLKEIGKEDRYVWESIVVYNQNFKKTPSLTYVGAAGYEEIWRYTLEFRVTWSTRVSEEGAFDQPKIEKIEFEDKESKPSYMTGYVTKYPEPAISTASGEALEPLSSTPSASEDVLVDYSPYKKCRNCGRDFIPILLGSLVDEGLCDDCLRKKSGW